MTQGRLDDVREHFMNRNDDYFEEDELEEDMWDDDLEEYISREEYIERHTPNRYTKAIHYMEDNLSLAEVLEKELYKASNTSQDTIDVKDIPVKSNYQIVSEYLRNLKKKADEIIEFYHEGLWDVHINTIELEEFEKALQKKIETWEKSNVGKVIEEDQILNLFTSNVFQINNFSSAEVYKYIIKFPEINITNSKGHKHYIKDLYMLLRFNPWMRLLEMNGMRGKKTYSELDANYTHSHIATCGVEKGSYRHSCCLGHTDYDNLYMSLIGKFGEYELTLFVQQLGDYLSWESIEGGPYCNINNIIRKDYNRGMPTLSSTDRSIVYKNFVKHYVDKPELIEVEMTFQNGGLIPTFNIPINERFKQLVTTVCPESYKVYYDPLTKREYSVSNQLSRNIERDNLMYRSNGKLFTFRGEDVFFEIYNPQQEEVIEVVHDKIAPSSAIDHIARELLENLYSNYEKNLNKYVNWE